MGIRKSTATTEKIYLERSKNVDMINLYNQLRESVLSSFENVVTAATKDYISWRVDGGRQFANLYIQKKKIRILTIEPVGKYTIGETVPDTHLWTLNYQTDIFSEKDICEVRKIILESYNRLVQ